MELQELINAYWRKIEDANSQNRFLEISKILNELSEQIKAQSVSEEEVIFALKKMAVSPHRDLVVWLMIAAYHPSLRYVEPLCDILENNALGQDEVIVDMLGDLADERCIPSLKKAFSYDIPADWSKELQVKILQALASIGTDEAQALVKDHLYSPFGNVRKMAWILIEDWDL